MIVFKVPLHGVCFPDNNLLHTDIGLPAAENEDVMGGK
jgi:hypothetical protein